MTADAREHVCTPACSRRCAELEAERQSLLAVLHRTESRSAPSAAPEPEEMHARNVRIHGAARAELARWGALLKLSMYMRACESRRKDRAMLEALEALDRAKAAEEGEARWLRIGVWLARRVDEAQQRLGRRTKLVTRIDFSPAPSIAEQADYLEPSDVESNDEEGDIKW